MFTLNFHVATMEANALIPLFTFILGVENNNNVKNDANLAKPILTLMKHCLQPGFITSNGLTKLNYKHKYCQNNIKWMHNSFKQRQRIKTTTSQIQMKEIDLQLASRISVQIIHTYMKLG